MKKPDLTKDQIFHKVSEILSKMLLLREGGGTDQPSITMDTDIFTDLGVDSLEGLDLLTAIEEEFDINPDQFETNDKRQIHKIVDYIAELLERKRHHSKPLS